MSGDLFLYLILALLYQPFDKTSVVFLCVNHVALLSESHHSSGLLFSQINNSLQLSIFSCIAGSGLFIERLFRSGQSACESSINVKLLSCQELVESKEQGLCSLRTNVYYGLVLFLGDFELFAVEDCVIWILHFWICCQLSILRSLR